MKSTLRLLLLYLLAFCARPFVRVRSPQIARILYIKPDHLGDLLLATPVLEALRAQHPDAQITALVGPWSHAVLARNPDIDVLLTCPFPGFTRDKAKGQIADALPFALYLLPYITLAKYALLLRAERYDVAIIGRDDHWWGASLALLAGVPRRVGYAAPACHPFLTDALPWNPREHVTRQGLKLVARLNEQRSTLEEAPASEMWSARFDAAPADLAWADAWLHAHDITPADQLIILHPGTAGPTKLWRVDRWAAVITALQASNITYQAARIRLVFTGGPDEIELVEEIAAQLASKPLNLAGQTTLGQLAALLRRATLVLGVDSGPLHLAAAQRVPTVHLYGPSDAERFGPWGDPARHRVLSANIPCSPCGVFAACPRGLAQPECMERITVGRVLAEAQRLLASHIGSV